MGAVGLADHSARAAGPLPTRPFEHRLSARSVSCALPLCHLQTASIWHFASRAWAYLSRPRPCATGVHAVPPLAAGGRATCASFCAYVAGTHGTVHSTPWQLPLLPAALQHSGSTYDRCQAKPTTVYQSLPQFFSDALRALIGGRCHSSLRRRITHTLANRRFQRPHCLRRSTTHTRFRWPKLLRAQYTSSRLIQLRFARFHCLARSESGRRSSLENPASASVNLDCRPLVPTSALACPLPGNLSHLSLSFFFFLRSRKRQTSVAQVHPFPLPSCHALVSPLISIAVTRPHQPRADAAGRLVHSALSLSPCTYISLTRCSAPQPPPPPPSSLLSVLQRERVGVRVRE